MAKNHSKIHTKFYPTKGRNSKKFSIYVSRLPFSFAHALLTDCSGARVGQNLAWYGSTYSTVEDRLEDRVMAWANEAKDYNLESNKCRVGRVCGHYTQMVWAETTQVV